MATYEIIQVGSHIGDYYTDKVFHKLNSSAKTILIEPIKTLFDRLVENCTRSYPGNNFIFLNIALSNKKGKIKLYVPDIEIFSEKTEPLYIEKGLPRWTDQLTSVYKDHIKDHYINLNFKEFEIECKTLNEIIDEYQVEELNELHVDTEGHDYEILEGLDFNKLKPNKIVFEHKHMEGTNKKVGEKYQRLMERLYSNNYKLTFKDTEDTIVELNL
jgi:FkbM family methyltransferase